MRAGPTFDMMAIYAKPIQRTGQRELRMAGAIGNGFPGGVFDIRVETGQDDGPLWQIHGRTHQQACCGGGTGRARYDHRMIRRGLSPLVRQGFCGCHAPGHRVGRALFFQIAGPDFGDDCQEFGGDLPVLGKVCVKRQTLQPVPVDILAHSCLIQQGRQLISR